MADPLSQLRQFNINGREIKEQNGYIIFGEHGWPKDVNTNYQIYSTDDDKSKKGYYTLECLHYFLKNMDLMHTHYVKQAGYDKKPAVMRPDRNSLLAYLKGESQTAPGIDKNAPIPSLRVHVSEILKRDSGSSGSQATGSQSSGDSSRPDAQASSAKKRSLPQDELLKLREEHAARLNEPSSKKLATSIPTDGSRKAGETNEGSAAVAMLGPEKVAAMRAKAMANKRTQIVEADGEPGAGSADNAAREDLLYQMDTEKTKLIKSKEKIWRTRTSILQSHKKDWGKNIVNMINLLTKPDDPLRKPTHGSTVVPPHDPLMMNPYPQANSSAQQQQQAIQKSYNRYDQERFVKLDIGVEIDTKKSFVGGVSNGLAGVQPTARPAVMGVVSSNGAPPMLPRPPGDVVDHRRTPSRPTKKVSTVPIIIIPATTTSIINMYNAATILQDLTYVEGKAGARGRENEILIQRKKQDGTSAHYKVIDNPQKLELEDWNRVVAVFVQGPSWQFKGWPWGGSPVEIFARIKGFHLKWDEVKLDDNVAKWSVQVLELSRNKRHLDKANLMRFWSALDVYMMKYKTFLKF